MGDGSVACFLGNGLGARVAGLGDADGDGLADLLITSDVSTASALYVYASPISGYLETGDADATIARHSLGRYVGDHPVAGVDLDSDGYTDLLVDDSTYPGGAEPQGEALILHGPFAGDYDLSSVDATLVGEDAGDEASSSLAAPGDLDGDCVPDLVIGAQMGGSEDRGTVYVEFGPFSGTMLLADAPIRLHGDNPDAQLGLDVGGGGDLDGDGLPDIYATAGGDDEGGWYAGALWVIPGTLWR